MLCGDTKEIMRKNSEKGRKFRLPGRNRAEDETPRILFKDAAALYIEFSKAATAAETAIKRMRFFDDVTWRTFFTFQYYTGCRIGETLALQEKDYTGDAVRVDKSLSKRTLTDDFFENKSTKTGKRRTVPLPRLLQHSLDEYIAWKRAGGIPDAFLFCNERGEHLPHSTIRRRFGVYNEAAGLPRIKIHDLRHSYVSLLIHKGASLAVIVSLIGDSFEQVTNTYGHMYESYKINAVRLLDRD